MRDGGGAPVGEIRIGFDGCRVVVRSPAPEVIDAVERTFRAMVVPGDAPEDGVPVVGRLEIDRVRDGYRIAGRGVAPEEGSLDEARRAVRYHVTRALIEARPGRLWIHAAAACRGDRAVLVPGERGRGKSTLAAGLVRAGWHYLSDEAVPVDMADDRAQPFPLTPHVRLGPAAALAPEAVAALVKRDIALDAAAIRRDPVKITEIVLVRYAPGADAALDPVAPGAAALELLESCLNFPHHGREAVRYAAEVARRLPVARLTFSDVEAAVRLLEAEERARAR